MKLDSISIKNFKRFTDLTIQGLPESARLILLAGPNGCGKSSFFDALLNFQKDRMGLGYQRHDNYYQKFFNIQSPQENNSSILVNFHGDVNVTKEKANKAFYFRSAYRHEPDFVLNTISKVDRSDDISVRFQRMIDQDISVSKNYQMLAGNIFLDIFGGEKHQAIVGELIDDYLEEVRVPLLKLFDNNLHLSDLGNPTKNGTFRFTKGVISNYPYKNLSGGEKSAFDLILDLVIAKRSYEDTIFCIDEPELHMNTNTQSKLLEILVDITPNNSQLIIATHSVGMMRKAFEIEKLSTGSVVFLDFDCKNYDNPVIIEPTKPTREFWSRTYEIAFDDLSTLISPKQVVICEGAPILSLEADIKTKKQGFDAYCYTEIFKNDYPDTSFISAGCSNDIITDRTALMIALKSMIKGIEVIRLIDRDSLHVKEIPDFENQKNVKVLSLRNIESYLFDDEVLAKLVKLNGNNTEDLDELIENKRKHLKIHAGPSDNLKPIARKVYEDCCKILKLSQPGRDVESFKRYILAPLIEPGMKIYETLRNDIFN